MLLSSQTPGVLIEVNDKRIYIDPIELPQYYREKPADVVLEPTTMETTISMLPLT